MASSTAKFFEGLYKLGAEVVDQGTYLTKLVVRRIPSWSKGVVVDKVYIPGEPMETPWDSVSNWGVMEAWILAPVVVY